jgi:hypothetical protein
VGADDARLPSLHEIASRPPPANHAQRAGHQQPNPTNLAAGAAPLPARCAAAGCSLSVQPVHSVRPVCVCSTLLDPRSSLLTAHCSLLPASLASSGQARQARRSGGTPPVPSHPRTTPPYPPFPAGNPAARKRKEVSAAGHSTQK